MVNRGGRLIRERDLMVIRVHLVHARESNINACVVLSSQLSLILSTLSNPGSEFISLLKRVGELL